MGKFSTSNNFEKIIKIICLKKTGVNIWGDSPGRIFRGNWPWEFDREEFTGGEFSGHH